MKDGKRSASRFPSFCVYEGGQDNFERRALGSAAKGEGREKEGREKKSAERKKGGEEGAKGRRWEEKREIKKYKGGGRRGVYAGIR